MVIKLIWYQTILNPKHNTISCHSSTHTYTPRNTARAWSHLGTKMNTLDNTTHNINHSFPFPLSREARMTPLILCSNSMSESERDSEALSHARLSRSLAQSRSSRNLILLPPDVPSVQRRRERAVQIGHDRRREAAHHPPARGLALRDPPPLDRQS